MQYRVIIVSGSVPATRNRIYKNFFIIHAFRFNFFFDLFITLFITSLDSFLQHCSKIKNY